MVSKNNHVLILKNDAVGDLCQSLNAINNIINNNKDKYNNNANNSETLFDRVSNAYIREAYPRLLKVVKLKKKRKNKKRKKNKKNMKKKKLQTMMTIK